MTIYRGLNLRKTLNDVDDKKAALVNLGLNQKDLNLIKGLNTIPVSKNDMHFISGLAEDQAKSMFSLGSSSAAVGLLLGDLKDIAQPLEQNIEVNGQLITGGMKFNYVNYDELYENSIRSGDVSTSRVSAWSLLGQTLVYGGEVAVTGNTFRVGSLIADVAPVAREFRSEIPTHTIKMNVKSGKEGTGNEHEFIAMKGIPIVFNANFRNATIGHVINPVTDSYNIETGDQDNPELVDVPATWKITNEDGTSYNSGDGSIGHPKKLGNGRIDGNGTYRFADYAFKDSSSKTRKVEFFYSPSQTTALKLNSINLNSWPKAVVEGLKRLEIVSNDFFQLPSFGGFGIPDAGDVTDVSVPEVVTLAQLDIGTQYTITDITGTINDQWETAAGTSGVTYTVGSKFSAVEAIAGGAGKVIITALDIRVTENEIDAANFIIDEVYEIVNLGSGTDWNVVAGTTGVTYAARTATTQGSIFTAKAAGAVGGKAIVSKHGILPLSGFLPGLEEIDISNNNFTRAKHADGRQINANHQLNTLPLTLEKLGMNFTFQDSTEIDLLNYRNLKELYWIDLFSYYRKPRRAMPFVSNVHVSPKVSTTIENYTLRGHKYALLASGVCNSKVLKRLLLLDNDITGPEVEIVTAGNFITDTFYTIKDTGDTDWVSIGKNTVSLTFKATGPGSGTGKAIVQKNLSIASEDLTHFYSHGNLHGLVSMEDKEDLVYYSYVWASLTGFDVNDRTVTSTTFLNCANLYHLHLGFNYGLLGNVNNSFQGLPKLKYLNIRRTSMTVHFTDTSFIDDSVLDRLYLSDNYYEQIGNTNAFGTPAPTSSNPTQGLQVFYRTPLLRILWVDNSKVLTGVLPDFRKNINFEVVRFSGTSLDGNISITELSSSSATLRKLEFRNGNFTSIDNLFENPGYSFDKLQEIVLNQNRISATINSQSSIKNCPVLRIFNISGNKRPAGSGYAASPGFDGDVPDFSGCPNLRSCLLKDNSISRYVAGSLSTNLVLNNLDLSNNSLSLQAAKVLLRDLYINYSSAKRSGVVINISGNGFSQAGLTNNDPEGAVSLQVMKAAGWQIDV